MPPTMSLRRRALVTACAATGLTEPATRRIGAGPFLPALFVQRYANMGGLDPARFRAQVEACHSFDDERWCLHWDRLAQTEFDDARRILRELEPSAADTDLTTMPEATDRPPEAHGSTSGSPSTLARLVAPYAVLLADHALLPPADSVVAFARAQDDQRIAERAAPVVALVGAILRAVTLLQVSAFPGGSPQRMRAYRRSRHLFDTLVDAFATGLDTVVERVSIPAGTDTVHGYACLPAGEGPHPVVIVTNGLEGTVQELVVPLLRYHAAGIGVVVMEMPGSYAYEQPMAPASEAIYRAVIDATVADPRVDPARVGIVGVSFGGHWAARMAAADRRLACAVACGAPTHHSFRPTLGLPEIIIDALANVTGATTPVGLLRRLRALSLRGRYGEITQPLLVINGDRDTLLRPRTRSIWLPEHLAASSCSTPATTTARWATTASGSTRPCNGSHDSSAPRLRSPRSRDDAAPPDGTHPPQPTSRRKALISRAKPTGSS